MTPSEERALRLLRLCASPAQRVKMRPFMGSTDAHGNRYSEIFISLQKSGKIRFGKRFDADAVIEILA
jgi:hypothetical protein